MKSTTGIEALAVALHQSGLGKAGYGSEGSAQRVRPAVTFSVKLETLTTSADRHVQLGRLSPKSETEELTAKSIAGSAGPNPKSAIDRSCAALACR